MKFFFPKDFLFGAACSACQIESACNEGGKGEDVGEHFYKVFPEKYFGGDPNKSADFYHRYPEDIAMMKELGLKVFRFSIAWSRVFPNGPEDLCQAGLDYYSDMIDKLKEAGIIPFFDLFHCDLPYWVIEKGGILNPEFIDWFATYAEAVFKQLGNKVDYWSTVNEPSINCMASYAYGANAPFHTDMGEAIQACHNMILAHYRAIRIYKELGCIGKIGAVIHMEPVYAWTADPKDVEAADHKQAFYTGWWLDPMLKGHYPKSLMDYPYLVEKLPSRYQEELDELFVPCDYMGINYYNPGFAKYVDDGNLYYETKYDDTLPRDDYGFISYPQGLFDTLMYLKNTYPGTDVFITENGYGKKKWGNLQEEREDDYRIRYMREHLRELSRACEAGAPVKGYFHWTIMDTNELYAGGYNYIFGLTQINYETLERIPRKSWYYYQQIIKQRMVE